MVDFGRSSPLATLSAPQALASGAAPAPGAAAAPTDFLTPKRPPRPPVLELLTRLASMPNVAQYFLDREDHPGEKENNEENSYSDVSEDDESVEPEHEVTEETLKELSQRVARGYQQDKTSRSEWEEDALLAMEAAKQRRKSKDYPFPNAANVQYPIITIAAMQFNARAYPAICTGQNVVKAKIAGADPQGQKASRGTRVQQYISHQIVDGMRGDWEHDMDVLLYQLPVMGSVFKKSFWDSPRVTNKSEMISALDLVVNSDTKDLHSCPRISHRFSLYPYEIEERIRAQTFLDIDLSQLGTSEDEQRPVWFIEQHCYYDLDGDGYAEPWIVTQTLENHELVRITAGFDPLEILHDGDKIIAIPRDDYFTHFYFLPDPEGGFYGIGFGHLLRSFSDVIDTSFNQMLDAGHLQNAGGGFIGAGLDFQSEEEEFRVEPGKYHFVTAEGGDIRNQIVSMQFPGASEVLFKLLGMMIEASKQITSVQDILTGSASAQTMQPTTLMALIDQGMKAFTAVYKRVYDALSCEFRLLYKLNRRHLTDDIYQAYLGEQAQVQQDFAHDDCLVTPVADPNTVTMMQRMAKASFLKSLLEDPILGKLLNPQNILSRILAAGDVEDVQSCLAPPAQPGPAEQLAVQEKIALIAKLNSEAEHNQALATAEAHRGEHYQAQTANLIMGHQPDFNRNPPVK